MIPKEAIKAAEDTYRETLVDLRLTEGGGFKVASQNRRALHAALAAAAPFMPAGTKAEESSHHCESWQLQMQADGGEYCAACGKTQA